jgi:hypothetical protein
MFRISHFIRELENPTEVTPRRNPPGPVVIWNLIRRCNLTCKHCYSISADSDFPGELSSHRVSPFPHGSLWTAAEENRACGHTQLVRKPVILNFIIHQGRFTRRFVGPA